MVSILQLCRLWTTAKIQSITAVTTAISLDHYTIYLVKKLVSQKIETNIFLKQILKKPEFMDWKVRREVEEDGGRERE